VPEQAVLGLRPGDEIAIGADDFERLSQAFLAEIGSRFDEAGAAQPTA
jgi:hypothetical protein